MNSKVLKQRVLKTWQVGNLHRAWLEKAAYFPLSIPLSKPSAKALLNDYADLQMQFSLLREGAKKHGYCIDYKSISHRQLGVQSIPITIEFPSETIYLNYLGLKAEFKQFQTLADASLQQNPLFLAWLLQYPFKIMQYAAVWSQLLTICAYFLENPKKLFG